MSSQETRKQCQITKTENFAKQIFSINKHIKDNFEQLNMPMAIVLISNFYFDYFHNRKFQRTPFNIVFSVTISTLCSFVLADIGNGDKRCKKPVSFVMTSFNSIDENSKWQLTSLCDKIAIMLQ